MVPEDLSFLFITLAISLIVELKTRYMRIVMYKRFFIRRRLNRLVAAIAYLEEQRRRQRLPRRAWVWPRRQYIFEDLLEGRLPEDAWRENFRMSRETFLKICDHVRPELSRQDTRMRSAIILEKRVAVALHRLATGDSFRTAGLTFEKEVSLGVPLSFLAEDEDTRQDRRFIYHAHVCSVITSLICQCLHADWFSGICCSFNLPKLVA